MTKQPIPRSLVRISDEEKQAAMRVLESGRLVKGPEAKLLGEEFSQFCDAKRGIAVNSGTAALLLGLMVAGVKHGDEVITVSNTFVATTNAIHFLGAKPVLVDINPQTYNLNPVELKKALSQRTKAIIPVHLYGLPCDMDPIMEFAEKNNLFVLEDACQAHGANYKCKRVGSIVDAAAFSFFPTKNITVGGDGGILVTNDNEIGEKVDAFQDHGRINGQEQAFFGLNFRLSEVLAAIGRVQLRHIAEKTAARKRIASLYQKELQNIPEIKLPHVPKDREHVFHLFVPRFEKRDELRTFLNSQQIGNSIPYPKTINQMHPYQEMYGFQEGDFPLSEQAVKEILAIPIFPELIEDDALYVTEQIHSFYKV